MRIKVATKNVYTFFDTTVTAMAGNVTGGIAYLRCIGYDPGVVNVGLARVYKDRWEAWQLELPSGLNTPRRVKELYRVMDAIHDKWNLEAEYRYAVIEGAAYAAKGYQPELGESRAMFAHWTMEHGLDPREVLVMAPGEWRKHTFGNKDTRAEDVFLQMETTGRDKKSHLDAASALAVAMAATNYERELLA